MSEPSEEEEEEEGELEGKDTQKRNSLWPERVWPEPMQATGEGGVRASGGGGERG